MKITPITMTQNRYHSNVKKNQKNQKNPSFGLVDARNKNSIFSYIGLPQIVQKERKKMFSVFENDEGVVLKIDFKRYSPNEAYKPYITAELIADHVNNSPAKSLYKKAQRHDLQKPENCESLYNTLLQIKACEQEEKERRNFSIFGGYNSEQEERDNNAIYGMFNMP